ncbi:MAG: NC domain protein [Pseudomonadota bacterium]|nr:NC domain protein [Pseudomonadota bacterium]
MNIFASYINPFNSGISIISRPKLSGFGDHWGILLPNGFVAHSTDDKGPHYVTYQEFAAGRPVKEIRKVPMSECRVTLQRIQQEITHPTGYSLLENNCEIFANRVTGSIPESPQVKGWGFMITLIGLLALIANVE